MALLPPSPAPALLPQLRQQLSQQRLSIAATWHGALWRPHQVSDALSQSQHSDALTLIDQAVSLLCADPFAAPSAHALGVSIARLYPGDYAVLGRLQEALAHHILTGLAAEDIYLLLPRLTLLMTELGVGFIGETQHTICANQGDHCARLAAKHQQAVEALHKREEQLHAILTHLPIVLFAVDAAGVFTLAEGKGLQSLGLTPGATVGQSVFVLAHAVPDIGANVRRALAGEAFTAQVAVGGLVFETRYTPLYNCHNSVTGVIGVAIDCTEHVGIDQALRDARRELFDAQEIERLQLAHDLHDYVVQPLLALARGVKTAEQALAPEREEQIGEPCAETVQQTIAATMRHLRHVIGDLRPAGLDDLGLVAALEGYVTRLQRDTGATLPVIDLDLDQQRVVLPEAIARCLFAVAQEVVQNVLRHAQASYVTVSVAYLPNAARPRAVRLSVEDDGIGFAVPSRLSLLTDAQHFGLIGVVERVTWVGGNCAIRSEPGGGTEVIITIPLPTLEENDA